MNKEVCNLHAFVDESTSQVTAKMSSSSPRPLPHPHPSTFPHQNLKKTHELKVACTVENGRARFPNKSRSPPIDDES